MPQNFTGYNPYVYGWQNAAGLGGAYALSRFRPGNGPSSARMYQSGGNGGSILRQRKQYRKKARSFKRRVEDVQPAKHHGDFQAPGMTHNTLYTYNATAQITVGTSNADRVGDGIYLAALKLKGFGLTAAASGAFSYRVIVGFSGLEFNPAGFGSGVGSTDLFIAGTSTIITTGIINPKALTVLYDNTFDINSLIATTSDFNCFDAYVPINQDFDYRSNGSVYGKTKNLYIFIMSIVSGGTTGVTSTGTINMGIDTIFK